jgi:hypothetical protein
MLYFQFSIFFQHVKRKGWWWWFMMLYVWTCRCNKKKWEEEKNEERKENTIHPLNIVLWTEILPSKYSQLVLSLLIPPRSSLIRILPWFCMCFFDNTMQSWFHANLFHIYFKIFKLWHSVVDCCWTSYDVQVKR